MVETDLREFILADRERCAVRIRRGPPFQFDVNVADCPYGRE